MRRKNRKVVKLKRRGSWFPGAFLLLFAGYLLVLFIQSFTGDHVSIYEVNQKQIADNENLRGIILREETIVNTQTAGYINYYVGEGSRLSVSTTVYSTDKEGTVAETASAVDTDEITLSDEDTKNIRNDIASFRDDFSLSEYAGMVNFRYNVENTLLESSDISLVDNLKKIRQESGSDASFQLVKAEQTGIISFCTDGLEDLTLGEIDSSYFTEMKDQWTQLRSSKLIKKGKPVYRLVTSENWSIVVSLTKEQYTKLLQKDSVLVRIKKDDISMTPTVRTFTSDGCYYARLSFDKYMIHYLNNRYLDIEIQFNNADGLKIPVSSILKKKCYVIPSEYLTYGSGTSNTLGVAKISYDDSGQEQIDFVEVDVYYKDEDGNVYISADLFPAGTTIQKSNGTSDTKLQVTDTAELEGVYNCNQGYCKFRYINKLYENQEYAIVEKDNSYSISNYDHIILNPELMSEDEIIY
ncbi:MAG: hypothetical protein LUH14_07455 [Clostridiaceae bacterium]|nr:hypothetical protein [Clostridiaceae bacterium]